MPLVLCCIGMPARIRTCGGLGALSQRFSELASGVLLHSFIISMKRNWKRSALAAWSRGLSCGCGLSGCGIRRGGRKR